MKKRFSGSIPDRMTIIKLDKSGGCVERDENYMKQLRQAQTREYFYGRGEMSLSPFTQVADYGQMALYKVSESKFSIHEDCAKMLQRALHQVPGIQGQTMTTKTNMIRPRQRLDSETGFTTRLLPL